MQLDESHFNLSTGNISTINVVFNELDLIIYQQDYREKCIFMSLPPPQWKYDEESDSERLSNLLRQGLSIDILREEIDAMNKLSSDTFENNDNKLIRWLPILPLLALAIGFIFILLSIIDYPLPDVEYVKIGASVFGSGLLLGIFSCFLAFKNRENSIEHAIDAVRQYVEQTLNRKYKAYLVEFEMIERKCLTSFQNGIPGKETKVDEIDDDDENKAFDFIYYNIGVKSLAIDKSKAPQKH